MTASRSKTTEASDPLEPRRRTATAPSLPWRTVTPRAGESLRWECIDGRWIAVGLGTGERAGLAFVHHSGVLCEYVETYEDALALARKWKATI